MTLQKNKKDPAAQGSPSGRRTDRGVTFAQTQTDTKMENKAFRDVEVGTEMTKLKTAQTNGASSVVSAGTSAAAATTTCSPEVCRQARQRFHPPDLSEGPWSTKKTYFFVGIIVLMILWIIIYTILSVYELV